MNRDENGNPRASTNAPLTAWAVGVDVVAPSKSGNTLAGSSAMPGEDATSDVTSNGYFTTPSASTDLIVRFGGGVQIPLGKAVAADVSYAVSRVWTATPITTNGLNFGLVLKF